MVPNLNPPVNEQREWAPHVPSTPVRCASSVDLSYLGRLVDVRVGLCPRLAASSKQDGNEWAWVVNVAPTAAAVDGF